MDMPFHIPETLMPYLIGAGVWYGGCLVYFAPELTTRAIDLHVAGECSAGANPDICPCVFTDIKTGTGVFKNALFLSTFSFSDPRVDLFGSTRNPYIEYISLEARDRDRRQACRDNNLSSTDYDSQREKQRLKKLHDAEMEAVRIAQNKQIEEAKKKAAEAAKVATNAALDCEFGNSVLVEDAERLCNIGTGYTEEKLSWMELGLAKSKQFREKLKREWGLIYEP